MQKEVCKGFKSSGLILECGREDLYGDFDFGLENLSSIKRDRIDIDCGGARVWEVEAVEAVIRNTANLNPRSLHMSRRLEEDMAKNEEKLVPGKANEKEEVLIHPPK